MPGCGPAAHESYLYGTSLFPFLEAGNMVELGRNKAAQQLGTLTVGELDVMDYPVCSHTLACHPH